MEVKKTNAFLKVIGFTFALIQLLMGHCVLEASSPAPLRIVYGNGMNNTFPNVIKDSQQLYKKYYNHTTSTRQISSDYAYNEKESPLIQLLEVYRQRQVGEAVFTDFWRYLSGSKTPPEWFREKFQELASSATSSTFVNDEDHLDHIDKYLKAIQNGEIVLLVAHSQGNFYANAAWDYLYTHSDIKDLLKDNQAFGVLSVASPDSRVGAPFDELDTHKQIVSHITVWDDVVINGVRLLYPNTLQSNCINLVIYPDTYDNCFNTNRDKLLDFKHHGFYLEYLVGDKTGPAIMDHMDSIVSNLSPIVLPNNWISILSPADYSQVGEIVTISADAPEYASKVQFFLDDVLQSEDNSPPFQFTWNTANSTSGDHKIKLKSIVYSMAEEHEITVTVKEKNTIKSMNFYPWHKRLCPSDEPPYKYYGYPTFAINLTLLPPSVATYQKINLWVPSKNSPSAKLMATVDNPAYDYDFWLNANNFLPYVDSQGILDYELEIISDDLIPRALIVPGNFYAGSYCAVKACNAITKSGTNQAMTQTVELVKTSGSFWFEYQTYTVPDRIRIFYEGSVLHDSGCEGTYGHVHLSYSGSSSLIEVQVSPNCKGTSNTQWFFKVNCPL